MSIRFAPARGRESTALTRAFRHSVSIRAANDNNHGKGTDHIMRAALRHFAEYGIGAAAHARANAERALLAGERESYRWWLSICRTLDRRMADAVARRAGER